MEFESLFERWQKEGTFTAFVKDGIVDSKKYKGLHLLFVLREMNTSQSRDLRQDLCTDGSGWKTWNNVARWTQARLSNDQKYPREMSRKQRVELISQTAVLNLKKQGGGSRACGQALLYHVRKYQKFILEEIELCNPDLIVCCGLGSSHMTSTAQLLKEEVFSKSSKWMKMEKNGREWWYYQTMIREKTIPVLSFVHPQATILDGKRGHELFQFLYEQMKGIKERFL